MGGRHGNGYTLKKGGLASSNKGIFKGERLQAGRAKEERRREL